MPVIERLNSEDEKRNLQGDDLKASLASGETQVVAKEEAEVSNVTSCTENDSGDGNKVEDPADIPPKTHFENREYTLARDGWERQVKSCNYVLEKLANPDEEEKTAISEEKVEDYRLLRRKAWLNLALVSLKLGDYGETVKYAEYVLSEQPTDEKALYRRALGLFESGKLLEAQSAISKLADSKDVAVMKLKSQIERQIVRKKLMEKKMMQGVLTTTDDRKTSRFLPQWLPWNRMCIVAVAVGSIAIGTITLWGGSWRQMLIRRGLINGQQN